MDFPTVICWISPFVILGVPGLLCHFYSLVSWKILLANNVEPDQTPHYVASDLGLHCLPMTLLRVKTIHFAGTVAKVYQHNKHF